MLLSASPSTPCATCIMASYAPPSTYHSPTALSLNPPRQPFHPNTPPHRQPAARDCNASLIARRNSHLPCIREPPIVSTWPRLAYCLPKISRRRRNPLQLCPLPPRPDPRGAASCIPPPTARPAPAEVTWPAT